MTLFEDTNKRIHALYEEKDKLNKERNEHLAICRNMQLQIDKIGTELSSLFALRSKLIKEGRT
jgi:hypothetical protein